MMINSHATKCVPRGMQIHINSVMQSISAKLKAIAFVSKNGERGMQFTKAKIVITTWPKVSVVAYP